MLVKGYSRVDIALCAAVVLLVYTMFDGITGVFAFIICPFCCVALVYLKAHHRVMNILVLLTLCILSAILGVISLPFRKLIFNLGYVAWSFGALWNSSPFVAVEPLDSRHVALKGDGSIESGLALYTIYTQDFIRRSQARCRESTQVFEVGAYSGGMGAEMHFHAAVLAYAIEKGAIFAWGPAACTLYGVHCTGLYEKEHDCTVDRLKDMQVVVFSQGNWPDERVPSELVDVLPASFSFHQVRYWWRAQLIGYLMRFNPLTLERLRFLRHGQFNFSLSGAINVNIRGGDKISEARLISPELYVDKALELIEQSPLAYSRILFVTSDDPRALVRARTYAATKHLAIIYLDVPRMKYGNDESRVASFWTYNVTISMLLQLSMTSECAAWIGSRSSNWNRVIDMFRCTDVASCKGAFVEMDDSIKGYYYSKRHGYIW
jgi:hypothetical protein